MGYEFWYTAVLLILMTVALILEFWEADMIIFGALILLVLGGVVNIDEAFHGFSNHGMLTVGFLFIVAAGLQNTGLLNRLGEILLGRRGNTTRSLFRFLPPVSAISAFFNNTPIVAMLIPAVRHWAGKHNVSLSKFLIPLSYATILGGICTLIGTSTNLVVHGLMLDNGMKGFTFFELTPVGLPVALIGITIIAALGHRLLPDRKEPVASLGERTREFVVAMRVQPEFQHIGRSVEAAGLRHLKGLFLFQIERQKRIISPATPEQQIQLHDRLFFTGLPETIMELQKTPGLSLIKDATFDLKNYDSDDLGTFEVVVSPNSPLIGRSVRDSDFRSAYNAVIVAIHRSGERIRQKVGDIVFRPGDTLLVMASQGFLKKYYHSPDFYLVSKSVEIASKPQWTTWFSVGVISLMIVIMATGLLPILLTVSLAAAALVLSGCIRPVDARRSVDWKVLLIIASSLGIAKGLANSGLAHFLAVQIIDLFGEIGTLGILAGVYFMTSFYTEVITNNAAAALVVPIALSLANQTGLDPHPLMVAVAIAASASFATPIGYQTNLMVYGPGGYRFRDFMRIGIPMNLTIGIMAISAIYLIYL